MWFAVATPLHLINWTLVLKIVKRFARCKAKRKEAALNKPIMYIWKEVCTEAHLITNSNTWREFKIMTYFSKWLSKWAHSSHVPNSVFFGGKCLMLSNRQSHKTLLQLYLYIHVLYSHICCPLMCILTSYLFSSNLSSRNSVTMR